MCARLFYGLLASCFFSTAFIFNRAMEIQGGSWMWSSSLRFFWMVPMLLLIVAVRGKLASSLQHLKENFKQYLALEHGWLWTVLRAINLCKYLFSRLVGRWKLANDNYCGIFTGAVFRRRYNGSGSGSVWSKLPWKELKWSSVDYFRGDS